MRIITGDPKQGRYRNVAVDQGLGLVPLELTWVIRITERDSADSPKKRVAIGDMCKATVATAGGDATRARNATGRKPTADNGPPLNERQPWLLAELRMSTEMGRSDFERQFNIHALTAKRDLADLNQRGLIEFVGDGREGFYRLRCSAAV